MHRMGRRSAAMRQPAMADAIDGSGTQEEKNNRTGLELRELPPDQQLRTSSISMSLRRQAKRHLDEREEPIQSPARPAPNVAASMSEVVEGGGDSVGARSRA